MASYPTDLRYTEKHTWVRPDGKLVTLGITQAAVDDLGTVGFVEVPYAGELYKTGEVIGRVSGETKTAPIYMPFTGQISSVNQALDGGAGRVSNDPFGEGWILRIEPGDPAAVESLMDAADYEAFVGAGS